jgi:predicted MPP superfamily phosphohydrolase
MPRRLASDRWRQGTMHGYTARGVGTSSVDARFNCPPEIFLHTPVSGLHENDFIMAAKIDRIANAAHATRQDG